MARVLYLQTDSGKNSGQYLIDAETRARPAITDGNSLVIRLGAFFFDAPEDLSDVTALNFEIRETTDDDEAPFLDQDAVLPLANDTVLLSAWNSRSAWNAEVEIVADDLDYAIPSGDEYVDLWMVVTATYSDSSTKTLGAGTVRFTATNDSGQAADVTIGTSVEDILSIANREITGDDAGGDKLVFWDDSAGKLTYLTPGSGLTITGTTITAAGGGGGGGGGSFSASDITSQTAATFGSADYVVFSDASDSGNLKKALGSNFVLAANNLADLSSAATARGNLGVAIGSDVQAYNATLAQVAGGTWAGSSAITTLGTISSGTWGGATIALNKGGTGATTAAAARTNLSVDVAGTDNSTDVTLGASVTDILSIATQAISGVDPGADRLLFWDDSANKLTYLTAGAGLTITGTTIAASGGGGSFSASDITGQTAATPVGTDYIVFSDTSDSGNLKKGLVSDLPSGGGSGAFTADANSLISPTSAVTLDQATGNEIGFDLSYTVNKASSGNDTGLLLNRTDTASPGTSKILEVQNNGSEVFSVNANGANVNYIYPQSSSYVAVDLYYRQLMDSSGYTTVDWGNAQLTNSGSLSVSWGNRILYDAGGAYSSIDWDNRILGSSAGLPVLDWSNGDVELSSSIFITEQAVAAADRPGKGQIWVKNTTPCELWFTDDTGTDVQLGVGGGGSFSASDITGQTAATPLGADYIVFSDTSDGGALKKGLISALPGGGGSGAFTADPNSLITPTTAITLTQATGFEVGTNLSYTVNKAAGDDTGVLIDQTDTASPGTSKILSVQQNASDVFYVGGTGTPGAYVNYVYPLSGNYVAIDLYYGNMYDGSGGTSVDWFNRGLYSGGYKQLDWSSGKVDIENTLFIRERASEQGYRGGYGQLWVEYSSPQKLWFTDDTGTSTDLTAGGGGGGSGAFTADGTTGISPTAAINLDNGAASEIALDLTYAVDKAGSGDDTGLLIARTGYYSNGSSWFLNVTDNGTTQFSVREGYVEANKLRPVSGGYDSIDLSYSYLNDTGGSLSVNYGNRNLSDGTYTAVDWTYRYLYDSSGSLASDWANRLLYDSYGSYTSVDWGNRYLQDSSGGTVVDWGSQTLSAYGYTSVDWSVRALYDSSGSASVDWANRALQNSSGYTVFDFSQNQAAAISPVSTGTDSAYETAINAIITVLQNFGMTA